MISKAKIIKFIVAAIVTFFLVFPIFWILISSFKPADQILIPRLWSDSWTIQHYYELIRDTPYLTALRASSIMAFGTAVIAMIIVISASYAVYRMNFPGREVVQKVMLITYVFPGILLIIPVYNLMVRLGLIDNLFSVVIMNITFIAPFCVWLMRGFFMSVPIAMDESASLDGAGRIRILFSILLPLLKPGIATVLIYSFIMSWTEFTFSSILLVSEVNRPLPIVMNAIIGQYNVRWGATAAGGVFTLLPVVLLFALVGKYFVKGLTEGAIKE